MLPPPAPFFWSPHTDLCPHNTVTPHSFLSHCWWRFCFLSLWICYTEEKSHNICSFVTGFFHFTIKIITKHNVFEVHLCCSMCQNFLPLGTSLVAQWLRIRLPMQGTWVRALVWEDPTCRGATKPVCHNYWACALEPVSHNYWAHVLQLLSLCSTTREATPMRSPCTATKSSPHSLQLEKARVQQRRLSAAKKKKKKEFPSS